MVAGIKNWPSDADFFETSATAPFPGKYAFLLERVKGVAKTLIFSL